MFSVAFEVCPRKERMDEYLAYGKQLKPLLEKIEGFIDNERFESRRRPGWLLSHSTWRDEKAVVRWRTAGEHHHIQERGRQEIFVDYHLRVGEVTFDSDPPRDTPVREQRFDATEAGRAKVITLTEVLPAAGSVIPVEADEVLGMLGIESSMPGLLDHDVFTSIYTPGKVAFLASWLDANAASAWTPAKHSAIASLRHRQVRVVRDYGMFQRAEAPQYFPEVARHVTARPDRIAVSPQDAAGPGRKD
jgi:heme-degrading monooxygenase HmoA